MRRRPVAVGRRRPPSMNRLTGQAIGVDRAAGRSNVSFAHP
jgi:hypothetical protein